MVMLHPFCPAAMLKMLFLQLLSMCGTATNMGQLENSLLEEWPGSQEDNKHCGREGNNGIKKISSDSCMSMKRTEKGMFLFLHSGANAFWRNK